MVPFAVNNPYEGDNTKPLNQRIKPSVEAWLRGFYDADFVITDSFHACVFSIISKTIYSDWKQGERNGKIRVSSENVWVRRKAC